MNKTRHRTKKFPNCAVYDEPIIYLREYTANLLMRNQIRSVKQLMEMDDYDLALIPGLGIKSLMEIQEALRSLPHDDGRCPGCGQPWPLI